MRNLLALIFIAVFCSTASAQESKYIVFTSVQSKEDNGIYRTPEHIAAEFHDSTKSNYVNKYFSIEHKHSWSNLIVHSNQKNVQNPLRIYKKPLVWLDSIQYTDWDEVGEQKSKKEVEEFFTELHLQERIYMIDRRDFTTDSLTVIEARAYKPLLY